MTYSATGTVEYREAVVAEVVEVVDAAVGVVVGVERGQAHQGNLAQVETSS